MRCNAIAPALVLTLAALALPARLAGQTIHGRLLDAESGRTIEGGRVVLLTEDSVPVERATADSAGLFRLAAPRTGAYRLLAERSGYLSAVTPSLELAGGDTLEVEFRLSMRVVVLQPLTVVANARRSRGGYGGFYDRMQRRAFGTFIDRKRIEEMHPTLTSDLLRGIAGVQVLTTAWGRSVVVMRGSCIPAIYLDGFRIRTSSIDGLVSPMDLEGIEVYKSPAEVPVELIGGSTSCGAIALWTRVG